VLCFIDVYYDDVVRDAQACLASNIHSFATHLSPAETWNKINKYANVLTLGGQKSNLSGIALANPYQSGLNSADMHMSTLHNNKCWLADK